MSILGEALIVRYHYFHHVGFDEIGAILDISKGRVSQLHRRALTQLRAHLKSVQDVDDSF